MSENFQPYVNRHYKLCILDGFEMRFRLSTWNLCILQVIDIGEALINLRICKLEYLKK